MFKAEENLGHDSCVEVEQLRNDFFDYALEVEKERKEKSLDKAAMAEVVNQRLAASQYIGDLLNQDLVTPSTSQDVPPSQLVHLPSAQIAQAWAVPHIPDDK